MLEGGSGRSDRASSPPADATRPLHLHALHDRSRCYDPAIRISLEGARDQGGLALIERRTPLRIEIAPQTGGRARPVPRVSAFLYVDGVPVERYLVGYTPFQWVLDPATIGLGDHVVTGLLSWRDDHFGIAHLKVRVPEERLAGASRPRQPRAE